MTPYQEWVWKTAADIVSWSRRNVEQAIGDRIVDSNWYLDERYHEAVLQETKHSPTLEAIAYHAGHLALWPEIRKSAVWLAMSGDLQWAIKQLAPGKKRWAPREW